LLPTPVDIINHGIFPLKKPSTIFVKTCLPKNVKKSVPQKHTKISDMFMEKTCLVHGQSFVSFWRPTYRQREVCNLGWVVVMFVSQRASSSYCLWQPWWWLWELDLEACGGGLLWSFSPVIIGGLAGPKGSWGAAPPLLRSVRLHSSVMHPKWFVPSNVSTGWRRSFLDLEKDGQRTGSLFKFSSRSSV
jgi:hypothetical protein